MKLKVLHLVEFYLTKTMTFVYDITNSNYFENVILTATIRNKKLFIPTYSKVIPVYKNNVLGIFFYYLEFSYKLFHRPFWISKKSINNILNGENFDIIFCHFGVQGIFWQEYLKKNYPSQRLIVMFHGFDVYQLPQIPRYKKRLVKLFDNLDIAIVVSEKMKFDLVKLGCKENKIRVIYLGLSKVFENTFNLNTTIKKNDIENSIKILHVSGFTEKKGIKFLINSLILLNNQTLQKAIHFTLIGEGPEKEEAIRLSKSVSNPLITFDFLPYLAQNDLSKHMSINNYFIHTSITASNGDSEGIPQVIKEALYYGLPVISTYHSGIPEIVIHNENGFLVEENNILALSKCLKDIINLSSGEYLEICKSAKISSEIFSYEIYQNKLNKILTEQ